MKKFWGFVGIIIIIAAIGLGYFVYKKFLQNPCGLPVHFAVGNVDPRFKISSADVAGVSRDAGQRWNSGVGETALEYDPSTNLKINLVYDDRQAKIDRITSEAGALDSSGNAIDSLRKKVETMIAQYQIDLSAYNQKVDFWNSKGGAPKEIVNQLNQEKADLERKRAQINSLADILNKQIDEHNANINEINNEVGATKDTIITEGEYSSSPLEINIYTFGNKDELRLAIMHELGHAMSLDHDSKSDSIMYAVLGGQNIKDPTPTAEDKQFFSSTCRSSEGVFEKIIQEIKNIWETQNKKQVLGTSKL